MPQHARPGAALHRRVLPVLLIGACTAALGGLAALGPSSGTDTVVTASREAEPLPLLDTEDLARERSAARASRDRIRGEQAAARAAAAAAAAAAAQAAAEAEAARVRAEAEAAAAAAAKAQAEKAAAAKAAAAKAAQAKRSAPVSGGGACPVPNATFTDTYGAARSGGRSHQGTDLLAPYGSPVYAVVSGRVRSASSALGGISLYLDGDNGETYFYAHNSANVVTSGRVGAGDLIAKVGSTGNAGGTNHVHFERQVGGRSVNPYDFLRRLC